MEKFQLDTIQCQWVKVRDAVTANDTAITDSTKNWENKPSHAQRVPRGANGIKIAFIGDNAAGDGAMEDDTFVYTIYEYAKGRGPAVLVTTATATIGAQQVIEDPTIIDSVVAHTGKYADTITNNTDSTMTEIGLSDYEGNDGVAQLGWDISGNSEFIIEISSLTAGLIVTPIFRVY